MRPGGVLALEDPDSGSWHLNPPAEGAGRLIGLIRQDFRASRGYFDIGRRLAELLRTIGAELTIDARAFALPSGHPYLRLPLQFATALEQRLLQLVSSEELAALRSEPDEALAHPHRWATTFTLIQARAAIPADADS